MAKLFKGIFNTNNTTAVQAPMQTVASDTTTGSSNHTPVTPHTPFDKEDHHQEGRRKSESLRGSHTGLKVCLQRIAAKLIERTGIDKTAQEKRVAEIREKLSGLKEKTKHLQEEKNEIINQKIPQVNAAIDKLEHEIIDIKKDPTPYLEEKVSKLGLYIGAGILLFLTIYLFVFYSSASYSAFFKDFKVTDNITISQQLFDAQAVVKAYRDGITELVLILTIPFVFLGLGYLIHKFQENSGAKMYFQVAMVMITTFLYDTLLAYGITEKIYEITRQGGFNDMPPYSFAMAFQDVHFWTIIFSGFLVYIIWGFIFDFTMASYQALDKVKLLIQARREQIALKEDDRSKLEARVQEIQQEINGIAVEITQLEERIKHPVITINFKELEHIVMQFLNGWLEYMTYAKISLQEQEEAHRIAKEFLEKHRNPVVTH
jgi:predicted nuclease with TOPRIM domain